MKIKERKADGGFSEFVTVPGSEPTDKEKIVGLEAQLASKVAELEIQKQRFLQLSEDFSGFMDFFFENY